MTAQSAVLDPSEETRIAERKTLLRRSGRRSEVSVRAIIFFHSPPRSCQSNFTDLLIGDLDGGITDVIATCRDLGMLPIRSLPARATCFFPKTDMCRLNQVPNDATASLSAEVTRSFAGHEHDLPVGREARTRQFDLQIQARPGV